MLVTRFHTLSIIAGAALAVPAIEGAPSSVTCTPDDATLGTADSIGVVQKVLGIPFAKPPAYGPACPQQATTVPSVEGLAKRPSVKLDDATFMGTSDVFGTVHKFLGIPFAKPPTGDLRFNLPVMVDPYNGTHTVTAYGPACPQQATTIPFLEGLAKEAADFNANGIHQVITPSAEDCLSINVVVPAVTKPGAKFPVAVWIFGGSFQIGGTETYDGAVIVRRSIELNAPVIYVSMNYRVSAYGFLASKEVKKAGVGNLGLQDQRLALHWIQKYISAFGGDPAKVTIWGQSAGAISVGLHLITNGGNTEGLFRGAFMQSGSPIPVGDISHGQDLYDGIVADTGCSGASDMLQCLRKVNFDTLKAAVDKTPNIYSYESLRLAWLPRADGVFLTAPPHQLILDGSIANVPFVTGNCDDEGTLFSLSNLNISTEPALRKYLRENYIQSITESELDRLLQLYPQDITQGSPFKTSIYNALTPQFKRLAAIQGDLVFQAPRRFFLEHAATANEQPKWSFLSKRSKLLPGIGAAHGTDVLNVYGGGDMTDYLVNFVTKLDPNGPAIGIPWPQYTPDSRELLTFEDNPLFPLSITDDDYRVEGLNFIANLSLKYPL